MAHIRINIGTAVMECDGSEEFVREMLVSWQRLLPQDHGQAMRRAAEALVDAVGSAALLLDAQAPPERASPPGVPPVRTRLSVPSSTPAEDVLAAVRKLGKCRAGRVAAVTGLDARLCGRYLQALGAEGRVIRHGTGPGTWYSVEPAAGQPAALQVLPAARPKAAAQPAESAAAKGEPTTTGRVAFWLLHGPFENSAAHHTAGAVQDLAAGKFGTSLEPRIVRETLDGMVREGVLDTLLKGGEAQYFRVVPLGKVKTRLLSEAFVGPGDHDLQRLVDMVRGIPGADKGVVQQAVDQLVTERKVSVRTVGMARRYAKVVQPPQMSAVLQ